MNRRGFFAAVAGLAATAIGHPKSRLPMPNYYTSTGFIGSAARAYPVDTISFSRNPNSFKVAKYTQYRVRPK